MSILSRFKEGGGERNLKEKVFCCCLCLGGYNLDPVGVIQNDTLKTHRKGNTIV